MITRPLMNFYGGKFRIRAEVLKHFPAHDIYVEPFAGAASLLFAKEPARIEVLNDIDDEIVNIFRVMQDRVSAKELMRRLRYTPFARSEFERAYEPALDAIDRAHKTLIKANMGYSPVGIYRNNGWKGEGVVKPYAQQWQNWRIDLRQFVKRLERVTISNHDALRTIEKFNTAQTLFFADPPYVHETRGERDRYRHDYSDADHRALASALHGVRGMVVLAGYHSALYDALYADWQTVEIASRAQSAEARTEVLWLSPSVTHLREAEQLASREDLFSWAARQTVEAQL